MHQHLHDRIIDILYNSIRNMFHIRSCSNKFHFGVSLWTLEKYISENRSSKTKGYYLHVILLLIPFIWFVFTGIITSIVPVIWRPMFSTL